MNSYQQAPSPEQPQKERSTARPSLGSRAGSHAASAPELPMTAMHELAAIPIWPVAAGDQRQGEPSEESSDAPVIQRVRAAIGDFSSRHPKSASPDAIITLFKQRLDQRRQEIDREVLAIGQSQTEEVLSDVQRLVQRMNDVNLDLNGDIARLGVNAASTVLVSGDANYDLLMGKLKTLVGITNRIATELNAGVDGSNKREAQQGLHSARPDRAAMKIGTEFTFTSDEIGPIPSDRKRVGNPITRKLVEHWNEEMTSRATRGYMEFKIMPEEFKGEQAFRYIYPELGGWWYRVSVDPGCVETQTQPTMAEEFAEEIGEVIQSDIFGTAGSLKLKPGAKATKATEVYQQELKEAVTKHEETHGEALPNYATPEGAPIHPMIGLEPNPTGLAPHEVYGGGHLSLDLASTFNNDPVLFRNFVVDYTNSPWAMAALDPDNLTGPTIAELPPPQQKRFIEIIKAFDIELGKGTAMTIEQLAGRIEGEVYTVSLHPDVTDASKYPHNQALNFEHVRPGVDPAEQRVEVRRVRAQTSLQQLLTEIKLFRSRINQLAQLPPTKLVQLTFGGTKTPKNPEQLTGAHEDNEGASMQRVQGLKAYAEAAGLHAEEWESLLMRMDQATAAKLHK